MSRSRRSRRPDSLYCFQSSSIRLASSTNQPLGARMGRVVDRPEAVFGQVSVQLGRGHISVTQQLLHGPQVGAALQQMGGEGMAQGVGTDHPAVGQRPALEDPASVTGTQLVAPLV